MGIPKGKKYHAERYSQAYQKAQEFLLSLQDFFSCTSFLKLDVGTTLLSEGVPFKLKCPRNFPSGEELLLLKSAEGLSEALGSYLASFVPQSVYLTVNKVPFTDRSQEVDFYVPDQSLIMIIRSQSTSLSPKAIKTQIVNQFSLFQDS